MIAKRTQKRLIRLALEARKNAYSLHHPPIMVASALLARGGDIYFGVNVSNDCTNLGICSERVAIWSAVANGARQFRAIAIVSNQEEIMTPCGACRQVLWQFCRENAHSFHVILGDTKGEIVATYTLDELLPEAFELHRTQ